MYTSTATALGLVAALAAPAAAFFRIPCPGRILTERADPLISPGAVSGHVHTISGGNGFGFDMDYAQARSSVCSSCPIKQDLSNYWTPKLYYQYQNGSFEDVPQVGDGNGVYAGMTVYYLQRPGPNNDALKAFPEGFRMIAGDAFKRNSTDDFPSEAISFVCLDYSSKSPQTLGMPTTNCPDGLRAQVFFPSCWDGVNLDSANHESHMAYPSSGAYNNGACPKSHPVHMISLFYEVIYQTNLFSDDWYGPSGSQPFVWAMGDPTGYGYHGDFVNGWDVGVLQKAVTGCTDLSGDMTICPYFSFFTSAQSQSCAIPTYVRENINGPMTALPGCNPVQKGPGLAKDYYATCDVEPTISLDKSYITDVTQSLQWEYIGCGNDSVSDRTFTAASSAKSNMSVTMCVQYCDNLGYTYAGLEYATQCYCGNTLRADRAPVPGVMGMCRMKCGGNSAATCGGPNAMSLYKKCTPGGLCLNKAYQPVGGKPLPPP